MMFAVQPVTVMDSKLIASSFSENEYSGYNSATTYSAGARVIRLATHKVYESAVGNNTNHTPEDNVPTWWLEVESTNKWKPFDDRIGIRAAAISDIFWRIEPGTRCNFVGVFGVLGENATLGILDSSNAILSTYTNNIVETYPSGAPDWANRYDLLRFKDITAFLDVPILATRRVQVGVNGSGSDFRWAGEIVVGNAIHIGTAGVGSGVGYTDYSSKTRDYYGNVVRVGRSAGDHAIFHVKCLSSDVASILGALRALRARPAVYFTKSHETYDSMIFGFAKDPLIVHDDGVNATYTLEVEGAT